jgi:hypothetical protein
LIMDATIRRYLFGVIFFGLGLYQLYIQDYVEASLYLVAGLAFIVNSLASEPRLVAHRKWLVIAAWTLIIASAIIFLYVVQYKWF